MNNVDYPIGSDNMSSPWNEVKPNTEVKTFILFCDREISMDVPVDSEGNIFDWFQLEEELRKYCKYNDLNYIDYDFK